MTRKDIQARYRVVTLAIAVEEGGPADALFSEMEEIASRTGVCLALYQRAPEPGEAAVIAEGQKPPECETAPKGDRP